jgi:ParB family chromosome partitioning protein
MDFDYRSVPLIQIDSKDATYCISGRQPTRDLIRSIKEIGLLRPPFLKADGDRYVIISGFARIAACRQLGWSSITAGLLDGATSNDHCAIVAVADKTAHRALNLVEQAYAVNLLATAVKDQVTLIDVARRAGLDINEGLVEKLKRVAKMPSLLKTSLIEGIIALPVALTIDQMPDEEAAKSVNKLLYEFNYSLNQQREILDSLVAVSRRDDISIPQLLCDGPIGDIRQNSELDHRHKARMIRLKLKAMRYPTISSVEKQFQQLVRTLKLPDKVQLIAPPNFERRSFELRIVFDDQNDLEAMQKVLNRLITAPENQRLWDLYRLDDAPVRKNQ